MAIDDIIKGFKEGRYIVSKKNEDNKVKEYLDKFDKSSLPVKMSYFFGIASKRPVSLAMGLYKTYKKKS